MVMIVGLIVLFAVNILILSLSSRRPYPAYGPGRIAISFVAPFQKMIVGISRFFQDIWDHYFFLVSVVDENNRLRNELWKVRAQQHQYQETMLTNERLRQLLDLQQSMQEPLIAAQVIGKDPSPWFRTIMIDKGADAGVLKGRPVINPEGIVGLVVEATAHYAKVMLITDPNSAVDAVVQDIRARGIIKGSMAGNCSFNYVLRKHNLVVGDLVISSGMDGVFPKGLPVGQVATIVKREAGIFQDVTITPRVDFERLEEVMVVPLPEQPNAS